MPGDGPKVLWHSIRVDGLFAIYCFGGIETNTLLYSCASTDAGI